MTAIPATENPDAAQVGPPPPFDPELRPLLDAVAAAQAQMPPLTVEGIPARRLAPSPFPVLTDVD